MYCTFAGCQHDRALVDWWQLQIGRFMHSMVKSGCRFVVFKSLWLQVRAQIERAQALAAKLSDQTTVSCGPILRW